MAALEIPVAGAGAQLIPHELVGIHRQAHGTTRAPPFKARFGENFIQSLLDRQVSHNLTAGHGDGLHMGGNFLALEVLRHFPEVAQTTIGAGTDERHIDLRALDGRARRELHIGQRFFNAGLLRRRSSQGGIGDGAVDAEALIRADTPRHRRRDVLCADVHHIVEFRISVGGECFPARHCDIPCCARRAVGTAFQVIERLLVWIHIPTTRPTLDAHIAHRHAFLHAHGIDDTATVFISVANAALRAQLCDDVQDDILRIHPRMQGAVHIDAAHLRLAHGHRLRGQHIAHLSCPDAKGNRSECPVGRGMRVTTGNRRPRLSDALFRPHHMHHTLATAAQIEISDAKLLRIPAQLPDHFRRQRIREWLHLTVRRHNVIHRGKRAVGEADLQPQIAQHAEGLRAGDFMDQMRADQQLRLSVAQLAHSVCVPDFFKEGLAHEIANK